MGRGRKGKAGQRRVDFRPNRQQPGRRRHLGSPNLDDESVEDVRLGESVRAKGDLSRKRTVMDHSDEPAGSRRLRGRAVAVRGAYVEVDDGSRLWLCTIRRILRTRTIQTRSPVIVGDEVTFSVTEAEGLQREGVIDEVHPRRSMLARSDGRRSHLIAVNVDQAVIVGSIREPMVKEHLLDRYLVAVHAGHLGGIVCINKADLDEYDEIPEILARYTRLGYAAVATSARTGRGLDELRTLLAGKITIVAGQSGVGKSSLLNAVNPAWDLKTTEVSEATEKGKHTTTTTVWLKLPAGGAVVDTPGIRALDLAMVPLEELEMHFVEFVDRLQHCKFPDCIHIHEENCAIKAAVEAGQIDPMRYASYVELFMELSELRAKRAGR